ncbi:MAG: hypothetical protein PHD76_06910 [Methylacidiphilales bacterium]|nr:hypothetical protein [Candidatus Methylacidiphilales bacterium]
MTFVDLLIKLAKRSPIFIPLFLAAGFLLAKGAILFVFLAFALGIPAAILIAHPIAEYLGEFAGRLYMPITKVTPQPLWYLVEYLLEKERYEDALEEYNKILHYHPQELRAHLGRLELLIVHYRDFDAAQKAFRNSLKKLKEPKDRDALTASYNSWMEQSQMHLYRKDAKDIKG